jgi:hypothetical protein
MYFPGECLTRLSCRRLTRVSWVRWPVRVDLILRDSRESRVCDCRRRPVLL